MKSLVAVVSFAAARGDAEQPVAMPTADAEQPAADAGEGLLFWAQQRFPVGETAKSVAVADLNGDGRPRHCHRKHQFRRRFGAAGNGDGSFLAEQRYPAGDVPDSVVADLNGDRDPDIVTANAGSVAGSDDVSVLLGNGDGSFQAEQRFPVGDVAQSVAVADLNGHGAPDIVTANAGSDPGSDDVSVLLGNGDGSFQDPQLFDAGDFPDSVAVADLNGDGTPGIVTANADPSDVSVLSHR